MKKLPPPVSRSRIVDLDFLEHRARLLDLAAFLDRVDRYSQLDEKEDFRLKALRSALQLLDDGQGERVRRILELWSDPTEEPIESAAGMKGATGVWRGPEQARESIAP